jgi:hypothetical protein
VTNTSEPVDETGIERWPKYWPKYWPDYWPAHRLELSQTLSLTLI